MEGYDGADGSTATENEVAEAVSNGKKETRSESHHAKEGSVPAESKSEQVQPPTPPLTSRRRYNFSAASNRDQIVFGSERPGHVHPSRDQPITPRAPPISAFLVKEWITFMKENGIKRVMVLLTDAELSFFEVSFLDQLRKAFDHVSLPQLSSAQAFSQVIDPMYDAEKAQEPIVVLCSTGQSRTGAVLALWLHHRYRLSTVAAVHECLRYAKEVGATRRASPESVMRLLAGTGHAFSALTSAGGTPRYGSELHITFIQMGGTIDKDFPESTNNFGYEIGGPTVEDLIRNLPKSFPSEVVSGCRKDGRHISKDDREQLLKLIEKTSSQKIIVTHGLESIIESAQYIGKAEVCREKTIVFTGANRPSKMIGSDAPFQIGGAVVAASLMASGSYICVNGKAMDCWRCRRDTKTGLFIEM